MKNGGSIILNASIAGVKGMVAVGWTPPEEIAQIALFLGSEDSSFITGIELTADGGTSTSVKKNLILA